MSVVVTVVAVAVVSVCWVIIPPLLSPSPPPVWGGDTHKHFTRVQELFRKAVEDRRIKGGSVAAYYKGELVVDLWGGYADLEARRPWNRDTVTVFYSTTKIVAAVVIAMMVDKGLLDYTEPVSRYWPEFGQNGKEKITVEMLLSHQGGLAVVEPSVSLVDLRDRPGEVEQVLAAQRPQFTPGSAMSYQTVSYGLFVDTLAKKADPKHRNISEIFRQDIAEAFGIDFHLSLPLELHHRAARIYPLPLLTALWRTLTTANTEAMRIIYLSLPFLETTWERSLGAIKELSDLAVSNDPDMASIAQTSFSGQGTARSLAKLFSIVANGGTFQGKQLLSPSAIKSLGTPIAEGTDQTYFDHAIYGPGSMLRKSSKGERQIGHPGFGGQVAFGDPSSGISFAFCMNHLDNYHFWTNPTLLELQEAVYQAVDRIGAHG